MRILAIRGENLASLAAPFAIDLAAGPIGATGIFAITGETGAGKSTILDALCLALYGRYPRVAAGRREDTPDPSGETVSSTDGRAILRRGASGGFAEVDFIGQDGISYCARWETFRARGRADGRLQNDRRSLIRIDDGTAVETGKTLVSAAVERLTDLTFDQFRRTVLLAQGEFDAFLLAGEGERSELLEKITGTGIYSEISKQIHAGTETRRAALKLLETRRDAIGLLDEPARAAILTERGAVVAEVEGIATDLGALRAQLDGAARVAAGRAQVAAAGSRLAASQAAVTACQADRDRLAELDAVAPLRPLSDERALAVSEQAEARLGLTAAQTALAGAESAAATALAAHAQAQQQDAEIEARFKTFGPIWTEAARLDSRIEAASEEVRRAERAAQESDLALGKAVSVRDAVDQALATVRDAEMAASQRLRDEASRAMLADRAEEVAALFAAYGATRAACISARSAAAEAQETDAHNRAVAAAEDRRIVEIRAERDGRLAQRAERMQALAALDEKAVQHRDIALCQCIEAVGQAMGAARAHLQGASWLEAAEMAAAAARDARMQAEAARDAADSALALTASARREIAALAELADGSVSVQAAHLRSLLVPGEACPVCGATEHPGGRSDDHLSVVAEAIRGRRDALDRELQAAMEVRAGAAASAVAETQRIAASEREAEQARAVLVEAADVYVRLRPVIEEVRERAGLDGSVPDHLDAEAAGCLERLDTAARHARSLLAETLEAAQRLRSEIADESQALELAGSAIEDAEKAARNARDACQAARVLAERENARLLALDERLAALARDVAPSLTASDLSLSDLDRDAAAAGQRVKAIGVSYRGLREGQRALEVEMRDLVIRQAGSAATVAGAMAATDAARTAAESRLAEIAALRVQRAALLGGEETGTHRTRINDGRRAAREALEAAHAGRSEAAARRAAAQAALDAAMAREARGTARLAAAQSAFLEACGPRHPDHVAVLLATAPAVTAALRSRVETVTREASEAEAALATRRADLETLVAGIPEIDVPTVEAAASKASDAMAARQQRLGAIASEIARDDAARLQAAGFAEQIAAMQADFAYWEAVNEAVGSANGAKFSRFAQGVTLEHLVQLANVQLNALSPRYRLARSRTTDLALHVVDRDMGDEVRATRSLSGGERFLVSLALALALSGLEGRQSFVDTLFIDEGFGSLDAETLDLAVDALETLQGRGRKVGVITHVAAMIERIAVQVRVEKRGNGRSVVRVIDGVAPAS